MMFADLRDAVRQVRRRPLLTVGVLVITAVAVAANTTLFAIVDGLLLRPLPYRDSERLVSLRLPVATTQRLTPMERARLKEAVEQTSLLADRAIDGFGGLFEREDDVGLVNTAVSSNLFDLLGVRPMIGSGLPPAGTSTAPPSVVVGDTVWRVHFGADPSVVGSRVLLQGREVCLAGVMPPSFGFPRGTNVWTSLNRFQRDSMPSVARLARHATVAQLQHALAPIEVRPLREAVRPSGALTLVLLLAGSGFLLLIAWTQVAGLQLARAPDRLRETAVRLALGATRASVIRKFAVETLVLSTAALGVAWLLTIALLGVVTASLPPTMMQGRHAVADLRVFVFACGLCAVGIAFSAVVPVWWVAPQPLAGSLRDGAFAKWGRPNGWPLRRLLLTGQLAVTALLLYTAGLAVRAFIAVDGVELGFEPAGLYVLAVPPWGLSEGPEAAVLRRQQHVLDLLDAVRQLRGVKGAAAGTTYPLRHGGFRGGLSLPRVQAWVPITARMNYVTPDYFRVLRQQLVAGREPTGRIGKAEAVVNETLGRALAVHGPVVGQQIAIGGFFGEVVGIAGNCVNERPDEAPDPEVYIVSTIGLSFVLARINDDPTLKAALQTVVDRLAYPAQGRAVRSVEDERRRASTDYRTRMLLLTVLAAVGAMVAVLGVAGGLYYEVRQQTRSIAIRSALGAGTRDITCGVLRRALGSAAIAAASGSAAGAAVGRAVRSLLFNISGIDVPTVMGVCGVLLGVALAASYPAVRQALAVDPSTALRHE